MYFCFLNYSFKYLSKTTKQSPKLPIISPNRFSLVEHYADFVLDNMFVLDHFILMFMAFILWTRKVKKTLLSCGKKRDNKVFKLI